MKLPSFLAPVLPLLLLAAQAPAQSGTLDQVIPVGGPGFSGHHTFAWQQQVRAGVAGQLESVDVSMYGFTNTSMFVRIRLGDAPNTSPVLAERLVNFNGPNNAWILVDLSADDIQLAAGETFVVECQGDGSNPGIKGTSEVPSYPEPLFLNGSPFSQPTYRLSLRTYMLDGFATEFCFGVACPCGNDDPGAGCANSTGQGAYMSVSAGGPSVAADDLELSTTGLPANVSGIVFMGSSQILAPFGDGLRCAGNPIRRFPLFNSGPSGSTSLTGPVGLRPGDITSGSTWTFQTWYRNPSGPCGGNTNVSNAVRVVFAP